MKEKYIGRKVWEMVNKGFTYIVDKTKTYTIKGVANEGEYPIKFVLADEDGNEKVVEEYYVLFTPNESVDEEQMIYDYLSINKAYPSEVYKEDDMIFVSILWGDWKHEHLWCDRAMAYIGYDEVNTEVTEENGSDCYSATHCFMKSE